MASCTQIDGLLQAYIDRELGASERVILEQHVSECPACAGLLKRHRRSSAALFEAYSGARLSRDLSEQVLEHLPELEHVQENVEALNWRAKHPGRFGGRMRPLVPVAAAVLLLVLGGVIQKNWPRSLPVVGQLGMVAFSQGEIRRIDAAGNVVYAAVRSAVYASDRYQSSDASGLMLTLDGATHIKMGENSRMRIEDSRTIVIAKGQVHLDVGKTDRIFRVFTPTGNITVFGTRFAVTVLNDSTIVAVEEGEVQIDHRQFGTFATLVAGQIVSCRQDVSALVPWDWEVDVDSSTQWAKSITRDSDTLAVLAERYPRAGVLGMDEPDRFPYREFRLKNLNHQRLDSIVLSWEPNSLDRVEQDYCGYDVYVYTDTREMIFRGRVEGSVFSNPQSTRFELLNDSLNSKTSKFGWVRLVPDSGEGLRQIKITVQGRIGTNDELN